MQVNKTAKIIAETKDLSRHYTLAREKLFQPPKKVQALNNVSLKVRAGFNLGIVGESGSGKTTLARCIMALEPLTNGIVNILGQDLHTLSAAELRRHRRNFQMIFQDPFSSLNPRHRLERIIGEPLDQAERGTESGERYAKITEILKLVGLDGSFMKKYPHQLSGGQRQRIAIGRALITRPALIVADEPVSALDVSVQAQILNLLGDVQAEYGITFLLISHNLAVVQYLCAEVAVIYSGYVVEFGQTEKIFGKALHPYTRALLDAVPRPVPGRKRHRPPQKSLFPVLLADKAGCQFYARCSISEQRCSLEKPKLREITPGHYAACHLT